MLSKVVFNDSTCSINSMGGGFRRALNSCPWSCWRPPWTTCPPGLAPDLVLGHTASPGSQVNTVPRNSEGGAVHHKFLLQTLFLLIQISPATLPVSPALTPLCPRFQAGAKSQGQPSLYSVHTSTPLIESSFIVIFQNFHHQINNWIIKKKK